MPRNVVQIIFSSTSGVLLAFRQNTEVLDKLWAFPSGRIEPGELPLQAAIRESIEELAVEPNDLTFLGELIDPIFRITHYFYLCRNWTGKIINAEPHLCREVCWFDITSFPIDCTPTTYMILPKLKRYLLSNK